MKSLIIKIGGSILTDKKSTEPRLNQKVIRDLSLDLAKLYKQKHQIIIVHGAGSFGHPIAKKYSLSSGLKKDSQKIGLSLTDALMVKLNLAVINNFLEQNLPVINFPPHALIIQDEKKVNTFNHEILVKFLDKGFIPVLHGDVVLDTAQGCSIVSGDTIIAHLANILKPEKVIFLSDVDGIFDADPKVNSKATVYPEINSQNLDLVLKGITQNNPNDVTGEMYGKIMEIKKYIKKIPVFIVNGKKKENLIQVVKGKQVGTRLFFV